MVPQASSVVLLLPPAKDPAPFSAEINETLEAFHAFLGAAVADPLACAHFRAAEDLFTQKSNQLALKLGVAGVRPTTQNLTFVEHCWRFNLSVAGVAASGITADAVHEQIGKLKSRTDLLAQLAFQVDSCECDLAELQNSVVRSVGHVLMLFWGLLSDTAPDGTPFASVRARKDNAINYSFGVGMAVDTLARDFPLQSVSGHDTTRNAWRFNLYRLALQMVGFRPVN